MQIREITVTYGGKLNLGDYNSAHVEISITGVLNDGAVCGCAMHLLTHAALCVICNHRTARYVWRGKDICAICAMIERNKLKKVQI